MSENSIKREQAEKRQIVRNKRTPKEQLAHLDKLLGLEQGAKKERARLHLQIEAATTAEK